MPALKKAFLTWWPIVVAVLSGASGSYAWFASQVQKRIDAHDREAETAAHPSIQARLKALESYWQAHLTQHDRVDARIAAEEHMLCELYRDQVGVRAAGAEPDARRKAQAANAARERFRALVREGEMLDDAFRHALETWPFR